MKTQILFWNFAYLFGDSFWLAIMIIIAIGIFMAVYFGISHIWKSRNMRKANESFFSDEPSEEFRGSVEREKIWKAINSTKLWAIASVIMSTICLVLILIIFLNTQRNDESLKIIRHELKSTRHLVEDFKSEIDSIKSNNARRDLKLDSTLFAVANLNSAIETNRLEIKKLNSGIYSVKKEIRELSSKLDSVIAGNPVNLADTSYSEKSEKETSDSLDYENLLKITTDIYSSKIVPATRSFIITKMVYDKKGNEVKRVVLQNTKESVNFSSEGIHEFISDPVYTFVNKNSENVELGFYNLIGKNESLYQINYSEKKDSILHADYESVVWSSRGKGGPLVNLKKPLDFYWETDRFYERYVDTDRKRAGWWKVGSGFVLGTAGTAGLIYFKNHPRARIKIKNTKGDVITTYLVEDEVGKAISAVGLGAGISLIGWGATDIVFSSGTNQFSIGISQKIE